MKELLASAVVLLLTVSCGGESSSPGPEGTDSAGKAGAASGQAGNSASGGASTGGASSGGKGGKSAGGTTAGGVSNGGTSSAGMTSGGTSSAGANTCETAEDCVACAYPKAPQSVDECYCTNCNATPLSKTACDANQIQFDKVCAKHPIPCPLIKCVQPPTPNCEQNVCVAGKQR